MHPKASKAQKARAKEMWRQAWDKRENQKPKDKQKFPELYWIAIPRYATVSKNPVRTPYRYSNTTSFVVKWPIKRPSSARCTHDWAADPTSQLLMMPLNAFAHWRPPAALDVLRLFLCESMMYIIWISVYYIYVLYELFHLNSWIHLNYSASVWTSEQVKRLSALGLAVSIAWEVGLCGLQIHCQNKNIPCSVHQSHCTTSPKKRLFLSVSTAWSATWTLQKPQFLPEKASSRLNLLNITGTDWRNKPKYGWIPRALLTPKPSRIWKSAIDLEGRETSKYWMAMDGPWWPACLEVYFNKTVNHGLSETSDGFDMLIKQPHHISYTASPCKICECTICTRRRSQWFS